MEDLEVIIGPILTDKNYRLSKKFRTVVFWVNKQADVYEIRNAFQRLFRIKVERINIIRTKGKKKRVGYFQGKINGIKKALIKIASGEKVPSFFVEEDDDNKIKK